MVWNIIERYNLIKSVFKGFTECVSENVINSDYKNRRDVNVSLNLWKNSFKDKNNSNEG